jgi:enoyl-CoA hydratase/carnithine racemase
MVDEAEVLLGQRGAVGLITLNKPKAMNALSLSMVRTMEPQLDAWAGDDAPSSFAASGTARFAPAAISAIFTTIAAAITATPITPPNMRKTSPSSTIPNPTSR